MGCASSVARQAQARPIYEMTFDMTSGGSSPLQHRPADALHGMLGDAADNDHRLLSMVCV